MANSLVSFAKKAQARIERDNRLTGRVLFALDASGSREATWDMSRKLTLPLFQRISELGDLYISLGYFNGGDANNQHEGDQCLFAPYTNDPNIIADLMNRVECETCTTQIEKILDHAIFEVSDPLNRPAALIYIGDTCEESRTRLIAKAKNLGVAKLPIFMFLETIEGTSKGDAETFSMIAKASGGAYAEFNEGSATALMDFLAGALAFAVGGLKALTNAARSSTGAQLLLTQLKKD